MEELFSALMNGPTQKGLVSPFPQGVTLVSWELSDGLLTLNLSEQYGGLADVSLTLADYCLVLTMSQLAGVESVQIHLTAIPTTPAATSHDRPGGDPGPHPAPGAGLLTNGENPVTLIHHPFNVIKRPTPGRNNRKKEFP